MSLGCGYPVMLMRSHRPPLAGAGPPPVGGCGGYRGGEKGLSDFKMKSAHTSLLLRPTMLQKPSK
eukprot:5246821-Prymnesium_polylepis.1